MKSMEHEGAEEIA